MHLPPTEYFVDLSVPVNLFMKWYKQHWSKVIMDITVRIQRGFIQGVPKKMQHSDFPLKSVIEVQFNVSTCVLESEFRARYIWVHYRHRFRM